MQVIDLTHVISNKIPLWNKEDKVDLTTDLDYFQCITKTKFRVQHISMPCGTGTHIDAPAHIDPKGITVDQIELEDLIAPLIVIDITTEDPYRQLLVQDIETHENEYKIIPTNALVIVKTGWSRYWYDAKQYRNNYHFPSISKEAAELLLVRNIVGLGIDTLSPDGPDTNFPIHNLILGSGKYILENIFFPDRVSSVDLLAYVMPLKIERATEAPCRIIATTL